MQQKVGKANLKKEWMGRERRERGGRGRKQRREGPREHFWGLLLLKVFLRLSLLLPTMPL